MNIERSAGTDTVSVPMEQFVFDILLSDRFTVEMTNGKPFDALKSADIIYQAFSSVDEIARDPAKSFSQIYERIFNGDKISEEALQNSKSLKAQINLAMILEDFDENELLKLRLALATTHQKITRQLLDGAVKNTDPREIIKSLLDNKNEILSELSDKTTPKYYKDEEAIEILTEAAKRSTRSEYRRMSLTDIIRDIYDNGIGDDKRRGRGCIRMMYGKLKGKKSDSVREHTVQIPRELAVARWERHLSAFINAHAPTYDRK